MAGRETITQRIALEGGKAVKSELDGIGEAGRKAFRNLNDAAASSRAIATIGNTFEAIKKKAGEVGGAFGELGGSVSTLGSRMETAARRTTFLGAAVAGIVGGFALLVKNAANASDELGDMAEALGLTKEKFQEFAFAFGETGVSREKFIKGFGKFNQAIDEAGKSERDLELKTNALNREYQLGRISTQEYLKRLQDLQFEARNTENIFTRLGITIERNADGTANNEKALLDLADVFKFDLPDGVEKSSIAQKLFGKGSKEMIEALNGGRAGFERQRLEMERVAPAMSKLAIEAGDRLTRAFNRLGAAEQSARNEALAVFFPLVTRVVNALTEAIAKNRTAIIQFASDVATKITPIIDDLIAVLQGRDQDVKNNFILQARDNVVALGSAVQKAVVGIMIPAFKLLIGTANAVATAMNAIFGTDLTGGQIVAAAGITKLIGLFGVLRGSIGVVVALVRVLAVAFGGATLAIAAIGFAIGFFVVSTIQQLGGLSGIWNRVWNAIKSLVLGVFTAIGDAARAVGTFLTSLWDATKATADKAFSAVKDFAVKAVTAISDFFKTLPDTLKAGFDALVKFATDVWKSIVDGAKDAGKGLVSAFDDVVSKIGGFFSSFRDSVLSIFDSIIRAARDVVSAVASALSGGGGGEGFAQGGQAFSRGGPVWGAGTSTSDSIRARLSRGEFVERAKAVRYYGVKVFHALNQLRLPAARVRELVEGRGFNMGGFVDGLSSVMPRGFADGGLVPVMSGGGGNGRPVVLNIGGESFGMSASEETVRRLTRYSAKKQLTSSGRKPTWFGG